MEGCSMNEQHRIETARRAALAMEEFFAPAFDLVHGEYLAAMSDVATRAPWETDKITKLAVAAKVVREVRSQIQSLINDGDVAKAELARRTQIESISHEKRKILGLL
jgi:hypothetical protein